jgi:DNA-binding CsgD family transcriptional regulator
MAKALPFTVDDGKPRRPVYLRRRHPALEDQVACSPEEMTAIKLLAQGYRIEEIATVTNKSRHTIKRQLESAKIRKNARSTIHLISLFWASRLRECTCGAKDVSSN